MLTNTEPPTQPIAIPDRGAYVAPLLPTEPARDVRLAVDLAMRCGLLLLSRGAATADVESAVYSVAVTMGLRDVEVDVLYDSITLSTLVDGLPSSVTRVARNRSLDYRRLAMTHRLILEITTESMDLDVARTRIAELEQVPKRYPHVAIGLARGLGGAGIAATLGGRFPEVLAGFVSALVMHAIIRIAATTRLPEFYVNVIGGFSAALTVGLMEWWFPSLNSAIVVSAGIVILVPGVLLLTSVRDAIVGFPTTAAGRALELTVLVAGIVTGVLIGERLLEAFDVNIRVIATGSANSVWIRMAAAAVVGMAFSVTYHSSGRLLIPEGVISALGYLAYVYVVDASDNPFMATGCAALLIGLCSTVLANRTKNPSLIIAVSCVTALIPGLTVYRAAVKLTSGSTVDGLVLGFAAVTTALAIAAGVLLGEVLLSKKSLLRSDR